MYLYICPSVVYNCYTYFNAIKNITIGTVKKTKGTSFNDFLCTLDIFFGIKWFVSVINWVKNSNF